jgi:hypothetical protein
MSQASGQNRIAPLFLVGCPRSGTTLLSSILEAQFNLAVPLETHFIPYYNRLLWLWGDLEQKKNRERLLEEIAIFLHIWTARNNPARSMEDYWEVSLLSIIDQREQIIQNEQSFGKMAVKIFDLYAARKGCQYWADNSSFYDVEALADWDGNFPDMQVIHIVRDGRDVTLSWLKSWFRPSNLADTASRWAAHVAEKQSWGANNPERYLELRYEDLLDSPDKVIEQIAGFIHLTANPGPLDLQNSPSAQVLSVGGTHDLLNGSIQSANREKWKKQLSLPEQRFFEYLVGPQLEKNHYPRQHPTFSKGVSWLFLLKKWLSRPRRFFLIDFYMRKAKSILPLLIFLARRLGIAPGTIIKWLR